MKKTLKLVLIFAGGLFAVIIGALAGFVLIEKNKTYYIYDIRIVEPIEGMSGYVYTDKEAEYTNVKNQSFYMSSKEKNIYPIAVYASTSNNSKEVKITSSDTSIAKIGYGVNNEFCYVEFLSEGFVTITSELDGVKDTLTFHVYDQIPSDFTVYDYDYYGDYAELFPNTLVSYADDVEYRYKYFMDNASDTGDNEHIDGDLLRVDRTNLDEDIFTFVDIDSATKELVVKCKKPETAQRENIDSVIILQSFYKTSSGDVVLENDYLINLHIVLYLPEFLQIEVSSTPDFDEKMVFMDKAKIDISSITNEQILANPNVLDEYLSAEKAENYMHANGEKLTRDVFFTNRVDKLYIRFRMVYTNGDIVYLKDGINADLLFSNSALCLIGPTNDYYVMTIDDSNYFTPAISDFNVSVSLRDYAFTESFDFTYKDCIEGNVSDFYDKDDETGIYTFTYWDDRARFVNEIYDEDGNIVGFGW